MDVRDADLLDTTAFDERLTALAELIGSVDRPGDYCVHGRLFAPMPRVEVADAGLLSFPIPPVQIEALIAVSERAPYGRGEERRRSSTARCAIAGRLPLAGSMSAAGPGTGRSPISSTGELTASGDHVRDPVLAP